jgi:hypothetical protein
MWKSLLTKSGLIEFIKILLLFVIFTYFIKGPKGDVSVNLNKSQWRMYYLLLFIITIKIFYDLIQGIPSHIKYSRWLTKSSWISFSKVLLFIVLFAIVKYYFEKRKARKNLDIKV